MALVFEIFLFVMLKTWILCNITYNITIAILVATAEVPSIYSSSVKIKTPAKVSSGHTLRIKNNGVKKDNRTGDMYLSLTIVSPTYISDKALKLFRKAYDELDFDPRELIKKDLAI